VTAIGFLIKELFSESQKCVRGYTVRTAFVYGVVCAEGVNPYHMGGAENRSKVGQKHQGL
jgi:hypothetical protein